jgi:hypothetical protein
MGSIAEHKLYLIQQISAIDDPRDLELLEKEMEKIKAGKESTVQGLPLAKKGSLTEIEKKLLAKPIRKTFDKEAMMREQGWTGKHDKEGMDRLIKEMDIQEPIEELLAMLTK